MIVVMLVGFAIGIAAAAGVPIGGGFAGVLAPALSLIPAVMMLLGYWRYTEPDPGFVGTEKPDAARKVMRVTVMVQACTNLVSFVLQLLIAGGALSAATGAAPGGTQSAGGALGLGVGILVALTGLASLVAWAVQFFATMRYTRWMARRIPDGFIIKRRHTYMWLLPLLYTVGSIVIGLGALIALILYWNLLHRMRKHVAAIRAAGEPANLPNMLG